MAREKLMEKAIEVLSKLPDQKLIEVSDFTEFLIISRREIRKLTEGIQLIFSDSKSFRFLEDEKNLYSVSDLKEA